MEYQTNNTLKRKELEDCIRTIQKLDENKNKQIEYLENKVKELEDEHFKDKEIVRLKEKTDVLIKDSRRGFPISEDEENIINEWKEKHIRKKHWDKHNGCVKSFGAIGGNFTYEFTPTSIGVIGIIKCSCGAEFTFQEL